MMANTTPLCAPPAMISPQHSNIISPHHSNIISPHHSNIISPHHSNIISPHHSSIISSSQQPTSTVGDIDVTSQLIGGTHVDSTIGQNCSICNDKATGKHYNAISCDGCKGFFRRSVRKNQKYSCRYNRVCIVDKEKRNHCRYCRLKKCFRVGMRKDAVQNERDRISTRRSSLEEGGCGTLSVQILLKAELMARQLDTTWAGAREMNINEKQMATQEDICTSMRQQLLILVEWAKCIPSFLQLSLDDQIALLRAHGGEHLLLGASWRSIHLTGYVLLGNRCVVTRNSPDPAISKIGGRLIDEVIRPLQDLQVDETEYSALKAIVFFDPGACRTVGDLHCSRIERCRYQVQLNLEDYITDRQYNHRGRFGSLLLVLPSLHSIARELVEQVHLLKMLGAAKVDTLLVEMLLGDSPSEDSLTELPSGDRVSLKTCVETDGAGFPAASDYMLPTVCVAAASPGAVHAAAFSQGESTTALSPPRATSADSEPASSSRREQQLYSVMHQPATPLQSADHKSAVQATLGHQLMDRSSPAALLRYESPRRLSRLYCP